MVRYLFYTIGDLTYQSPLVITVKPTYFTTQYENNKRSRPIIYTHQDMNKNSINYNIPQTQPPTYFSDKWPYIIVIHKFHM